jgi:hypothetical protein
VVLATPSIQSATYICVNTYIAVSCRSRGRSLVLESNIYAAKTLTTDGPFVEIKEALGGYLFFEADNLDAAIELASRIPAARMGGAIEVRPLVER